MKTSSFQPGLLIFWLIEIIAEYGFPTRKLVGKDAMDAVFIIVQHANRDADWQKAQLPFFKMAVEKGDLDASDYAYLYDRTQMVAGEKQRFGTQFQMVDSKQGIAELYPVEDPANLDRRRMKMGLMPIELYRRLMLMKF